MNRRGVWAVMLLMALLVVMPKAWGQRPPETHPVSATQNIVMSWDRSAMPGDIQLLPRRTVIAYERAGTLGYGQLYVTCESNSDSATGRCPTADTGEALSTQSSAIPLRFTEQRSGMTVDVDVHGEFFRIDATAACQSDYWSVQPYVIWSSYATECSFRMPAGTGAAMRVPTSQLERLVAGKWSATLRLTLRKPAEQELSSYQFEFHLTITDRNAVSIYFPAFHHVTPLVQLNSDYDPIRQTVGGRTVLEMCLYDGLGSQAQYLGVTVRDRSGKPPGPSGYSLWHTDGGSDDTRRLDYTVTLDHNGAPVPMPNGVEQQLYGIDTALLRLVLLPGMSQPVFCVPTPITFDIPRVPISTQQAGTYFGELQVELRVPTVTP